MQKALSSPRPITVSGRTFSKEEIISIGKVVASCNGLSRMSWGSRFVSCWSGSETMGNSSHEIAGTS